MLTLLHFFGVGNFIEVIVGGALLWLGLGLYCVFGGVDAFFHFFLDLWLPWCAAFYLVGLFVCLYCCVRRLFPWEPKIEKPLENAKGPETVLTRPHAVPLKWKPGEDGSYLSAFFGVQLPEDGYYAFEIVVENPASPVYASLDTFPQNSYHDKEETTELRSVHRFYGRFSAGVYTFHLFMDGTSESDTTVSQLVG